MRFGHGAQMFRLAAEQMQYVGLGQPLLPGAPEFSRYAGLIQRARSVLCICTSPPPGAR